MSYLLSQSFCHCSLIPLFRTPHPTVHHACAYCGGLWPCYCHCMALHTALKWFILLHLLIFFPYMGHCLCWCPVPQYLQFSTILFSLPLSFHLPVLLSQTIEFLILSSTSFCASTFWGPH